MLIFDTTSKKLQVLLDSAPSAEFPWVSSWVDIATATLTPGANNGTTSGNTPVDVIAAPAVSVQRKLEYFSILNSANAARTVTVQYVDGGSTRIIFAISLAVGYQIYYNDRTGWYVGDTSGVHQIGQTAPITVTPSTTTNITGILKGDGANVASAVPGVDYDKVTTATTTDITGILKGDGANVAQAVAGVDYDNVTTATTTDITGILKGDGANVAPAVAGTDYATVAQFRAWSLGS